VAKNFYEILGVPRTASDLEIKSAYHRLARRYHPDKADSPQQAASFEAEFSNISTAYNTLKDKDKRLNYDKTLQASGNNVSSAAGSGISSPNMPAATSGADKKPGFASAATDKNRATVAKRAFVRGSQMMANGEYAKAAELFEVAIKNNESEAAYHARLAVALLRSHRSFNRATESAQRAIELDPYNSDFRLILAELYESANITSMALKTYEEILKWDPTNEKAKVALEALQPSRKNFFSKFFGRKR
jgi:curved DNA-binding protein CbpA